MNPAESNPRGEQQRTAREEQQRAARARRERLQFLIALSETDPAALETPERPGDLLNLAAGFYRHGFLVPETTDPRREAVHLAESMRAEPKVLRPLVEMTKEVLAAAADKTRFEWKLVPGSKSIFDGTQNVEGGRRMVLWTPKGSRGLKGIEQVAVVTSLILLNTKEGESVRRCSRIVCGRIFLATRPKQIFCGRRCASAAAFENYKGKIGEEAYRRKHREAVQHSHRTKLEKERLRQKRAVKPRVQETATKGEGR